MIDFIFSLNVWNIFILAFIIATTKLIIFRKKTVSLIDPLVFYIITSSISWGFVYELFSHSHINESEFIYYILCDFVFFTTLFIVLKKTQYTGKVFDNKVFFNASADYYIYIFSIIAILLNIFLYMMKGVPLFSSVTGDAKVELYKNGFGIVKRINISIIPFLITYIVYSGFFRLGWYKIINVFFALILIIILFLSGAKSALLNVVFIFSVYQFIFSTRFKLKINKIKKIKTYSISAAIFLVIVVFSMKGDVLKPLVTRLVAYGDTYYFYFTTIKDNEFTKNALSFIPHLFNSLTSFFRLTAYEVPLGTELINTITGNNNTGYGPNSQYIMESRVYFGYMGGIVYCCLLGVIIAFFRNKTINNIMTTSNALIMSINVYFFIIIFNFLVDSTTFMMMITDLLVLSCPILFFSYILPSKSK